ncbi:MAG: hypothetical protein U1E05_19780 [Patescibacteria group bacterium]|nr:hypothetical protein [Patescibacteria group bacterium]
MSTPVAFTAATATALIWLGLTWLTGYGLGPLAILLAVCVSLLLRGAVNGGGLAFGVAGAAMVLVVLLVGRLWLAGRLDRAVNEQAAAAAVADHAMLLGLAQQIAQGRLDAGKPLELPGGRKLPEGVATVEFASRDDVPDDLWQQAEQLWQSADMQRRTEQTERRRQFVVHAREAEMPKTLAARFGLGGLFWTLTAATAAFLIGSRAAT